MYDLSVALSSFVQQRQSGGAYYEGAPRTAAGGEALVRLPARLVPQARVVHDHLFAKQREGEGNG